MDFDELLRQLSTVPADALMLDPVNVPDSKPGFFEFKSRLLWTPPMSAATYGGQVVALSVEAAFKTVDVVLYYINSSHTSFLMMGDSSLPMTFRVRALRDGKSFASRLVEAVQNERTIACTLIGFHAKEAGGVVHQQIVLPCAAKAVHARACKPPPTSSPHTAPESNVAFTLDYVDHIMQRGKVKSSEPLSTWMRMFPSPEVLSKGDAQWAARAHLLMACWLSDFSLAFAALVPHGLPNKNLRMIASLDHTMRFHAPEDIRTDDWFVYEVHSPWADYNRGLNYGRMYSKSGKLWMTTSQETLLRMKKNYISKI